MNLGKWRDHKEYFISSRNKSINETATQTNNLIIRLDKLINRLSSDDLSKKDFEKSVVQWSEDSEFSNCRVCNAKFSITKRKHHCRLCGKIMCHNCSQFLSFVSARKLTGPEIHNSEVSRGENGRAAGDSPSFGLGTSEKRSLFLFPSDSLQFVRNRTERIIGSLMGSRDSLNVQESLGFFNGGSEELNDRLRICDVCKHLLDRREKAMDLRMSQSIFVDIYQRLCQLLTEISKLAPTYKHMAESLNCGKSIYSLSAAIELRRKMTGIQREIASLSDRIESWGLSSEVDDPLITKKPEIREIQLQRNIKIFAINSLHDIVSKLPELPSQETYESISKREDDGVSEEVDVLQQQYLNVKRYLEQAAQAGRLEEVEILEKSLFELESEIKRNNLSKNSLKRC